MYALGFIETKGLVGAIEAADAMLKSADVFLVERNQVGSGLVSITVAGEVSAVQAAVDAAVSTISRIEGVQLVSKNVIARHYEELSRIIKTGSPASEPVEEAPLKDSQAVETVARIAEKTAEVHTEEPVAEAPADSATDDSTPATEEVAQYKISQLKKMKISRVRQIARNLSGISLTPEEVKKAPKKTLIDAIINVTRQIEE